MQNLLENAVAVGISLLPFVVLLITLILVLFVLHKALLGNKSLSLSQKFPRQLILLLVYIVSMVLLVVSLPIDSSIRNQVLALIGVLLSGVIAFSSTSIVSNVMAGIVIRITQPFRTGDFVRVSTHFGRVTQKGLFDTEMQTEQRDLIHLTNSYLLTQPIEVVRSSGTVISVNLSLGYDLHHSRIEKLLIQAAEKVELNEPFVQIIELGDFSISYRVSGLLTEVKSMITARSRLMASVLDTLHDDNIEIVSPSYVNQRRLDDLPAVIAKGTTKPPAPDESNPEDMIFDKAEEAEGREKQVETLQEQVASLQLQVKEASADEKPKLQKTLETKQLKLAALHKAEDNKK